MRGAPSRISSPLTFSLDTRITLQPAGPPGFLTHAPSVYATVPCSPNIERAFSTGMLRNASRIECHSKDSSPRLTLLFPFYGYGKRHLSSSCVLGDNRCLSHL